MTYEEYWHGDPTMTRDYVEADDYRRKNKDFDAWLSGLYVAKAIASTIGNAFLEKGSEPNEYPEQPLSHEKVETEEQIEERERKEAEEAKIFMKLLVEQGKHWGKKDKTVDKPPV